MKRIFLTLIFLFAVFLPLRFAAAEEVIRDFAVSATLSADRMYRVTESITYDFGDADRHGIFRFIPITYFRNGVKYDFHPRIVRVLMDGNTARYQETRENGELNVKIGDPDETITGAHAYEITYETDRAINFFSDHSELYWNVTGNQWPVAIERSRFSVELPPEVPTNVQTACFTGQISSIESACRATQERNTVMIQTSRVLLPEEGLTIVIGMPLGVIRPPTSWERVWMVLRDNGIFFFPFIALIVMIVLWYRTGRDPKLGTIIPQYEPPRGMTPAELAAVDMDGGVPRWAIPATIIHLAQRGYLSIRAFEEKKLFGKGVTFSFFRKKKADAALTDDERELFEGIFEHGLSVTPEELANKHTFYKNVNKANDAVWKRLSSQGLYVGWPARIRGMYIGIGILTGIVIGWLFGSQPFGVAIGMMTGIVIVVIGWFMPKRTPKGSALLAEIKGFTWFMSVTEKDRLEFHDAPERTSGEFQALLPYAIALRVEKKWAKQFEGMTMTQPEWAEGTGWSTMNTVAFTSQLNSFATSATSMTAPPGSSGFSGGSSGGGGGGGGGGSW